MCEDADHYCDQYEDHSWCIDTWTLNSAQEERDGAERAVAALVSLLKDCSTVDEETIERITEEARRGY